MEGVRKSNAIYLSVNVILRSKYYSICHYLTCTPIEFVCGVLNYSFSPTKMRRICQKLTYLYFKQLDQLKI